MMQFENSFATGISRMSYSNPDLTPQVRDYTEHLLRALLRRNNHVRGVWKRLQDNEQWNQ
jgi:hypothetical protein